MGLFDFWKRDKKAATGVSTQRPNSIPYFFQDVPRNDEGIKQIIQWTKDAPEIILELTPEGSILILKNEQKELLLPIYTNVQQHHFAVGESFATLDFTGLQKLFDENPDLDCAWLNRDSDSVLLKRNVFSPITVVKKETQILIGQPAKRPVALEAYLRAVGSKHLEIQAIYMALINRGGEFSYGVYIDMPEVEELVRKEIGPTINQKFTDTQALDYPVDIFYDPLFQEKEYQLYP